MKQPRFWALFAIASAACGVAAYLFFPLAFSILALDVSMDREEALSAAAAIARRDGLGPEGHQQAASFSLDTDTQTFVELEGGGKDAFTRMLGEGYYAPYAWRVRHFKEHDANETSIWFTPDGRPAGFVDTVPESAPGPAVDAATARQIAEAGAVDRWAVDFSGYALVEQAQETRPNGRVDHSLTYERAAPTLGDGRYRLGLTVTGDRLTRVRRSVFIPEAFDRRYQSMRSANTAIGIGSVVGMAILYVFGGIGVGLFFLLRQRGVIVGPAVRWGMVIAGLQALAVLNSWPLAWMGYDTAVARSTFVLQQAALAAGTFVGFSAFFALSFMAAESLTRRAFGSHPQFWRSWSKDAGSSTAVLGRTVGGYLLVTVFLAYDVGLYLVATRYFGWWSPSETLLHPDTLATYVPWLDAIANSLQAGFWEECLFRAIPIAGAALIGDRFGRRGTFVAAAFVVQAVIFGAGHAPYPTLPAFARPVELLLPSIGFGLVYLYYGLVPGIVLHFAFDVVWFALPIFSSTAPGIWIQQVTLVLMTLVPLWVVLIRRVQVGRWTTLAPSLRNAAWTPPPPVVPVEEPDVATTYAPPPAVVRAWLVAALAGLIVVAIVAVRGRSEAPTPVDRREAAEVARGAVAARGATLGPEWRVMPTPVDGSAAPHAFIAKTAGEAERRALLGTYLAEPGWRVRIATFEGDVADRAEEWLVNVTASGEAGLVRHTLPEGRPGATLDEAAARVLAQDAVRARTGLDVTAGEAVEIEARPRKLDARTDWTFTFKDQKTAALPEGELRIQVDIAGDEVLSTGRVVHVPEEWGRAERATATRNGIIQFATAFVFGSIFVAAAASGVISWSRRRYAPRWFVAGAGIMFVASVANALNGWPMTVAALPTDQPLALLLAGLAGVSLVALTLLAAVVGLPLGAVPPKLAAGARLPNRAAVRLGVAVGLVAAGVAAAAAWIQTPVWARVPDVTALGAVVPLAHRAIAPVAGFLTRLALLLTVLVALDRMTLGWSRRRWSGGAALAVVGFLGVGVPASPQLGLWMVAGAITSVVFALAYVTVLRADLTSVPLALGTTVAVGVLAAGIGQPFGTAWLGGAIAALLTLALAWRFFQALRT